MSRRRPNAGGPRRQGRARLNPGRLAAGRALLAVEDGDHVEDILAVTAPDKPADRGLAWHLALGVLRRQGSLDQTLAPHLGGRRLSDLDAPVRVVLRVGAADLHLSRTPRHAAVSQAVELARRLRVGRASGLVNAVLRRAGDEALPDDPWLDLPGWLQARWRDHEGIEAWVQRLGRPAPLCGVWRGEPHPGLAAQPVEAAGRVVPGAFCLPEASGEVTDLDGFAEGAWWVMDPSAVAVADRVADAAGPGTTILDACAAPGGKTLRLASRGHAVTAVDLSPQRLERVQQSLHRTGLSAAIRQWDWLSGPNPVLGRFSAVLVDAPCTGLGTLRRHPEIKWRRSPTDPAAMALRQLQILEAASTHVEPGGKLVYAVCSPAPEEGEGVVSQLSGWEVTDRWASWPPSGDEDAHQVFVLSRAATT